MGPSKIRKYLDGAPGAYPGLFVDAAVLAAFTAAFSLRYYHSHYIFQGDVFLNLYMRAYHGLFSNGWDPYAWGYAGWYPVYGELFPLNIVTHGLIGLAGDTPAAALALTQINAGVSLFALSFFTYLLARFLNLGRAGSVLAAIIVSFTGFHVQAGLRELDIFYLHSFMFVPLVMIFLIKANRDRSLRSALAAGLMVGLSLLGGGNVPMFLFLPAFAISGIVVAGGGAAQSFKALPRSFFYALAALATGMLVGAAMTIPSLAYMKLSSRPLFVESEAMAAYDVISNLLTAVYREWWNKGYYDHELDSFLGLPIILLALSGLALAWKGRGAMAAMMAATAVMAIVGMYVFHMPGPIKALLNYYFTKLSIRFPFRFFMVVLFASGFFAAMGFDALRDRVPGRRARVILALACLAAIAVYCVVGYAAFPGEMADPARKASFVATMITALLFTISLVVMLLKREAGYAAQAVVLLVFIFYLFAGADAPSRDEKSQGYPRFYPATVEESIEHFFYAPAVEWGERAGSEKKPFRIFDRGLELRKNVWAPLAKADIAFEPYNDPASSGALTRFGEGAFERGFNPASPLNDLYNVKFMKYREFKDYEETSSRVFINHDAFDRFFVAHDAKHFPTDDALFEALKTATREELRDKVFLLPGSEAESAPFDGVYEDVEIMERSPARIRLKVDMRSPGWLVASELWFPAWKARVDGKPVKALKAYGAFRAVRLASGLHEVEFFFDDAYGRAGRIITLASIVISLGVIFIPFGRRPSSPL
jgi:hypothetical protein